MTAKADRIKKLLDDEDLQTAFSQVEEAIHKGWASTPPTKADQQREWHTRLHLLRSVKANLRQAIQDGQLEDFRAVEKEKPGYLGDIAKWRMKKQKQA